MTKQITREAMPSSLEGTIGLCYFNPETDTLHEFNNDVRVVLGPFEESVRRFYIVKPSNTISNKVYSYFRLRVEPSSPTFALKVRLGERTLSSPESFSNIEGKEVVEFFNNYVNGLIPIDFYTKNNSILEAEFHMDITIEVF